MRKCRTKEKTMTDRRFLTAAPNCYTTATKKWCPKCKKWLVHETFYMMEGTSYNLPYRLSGYCKPCSGKKSKKHERKTRENRLHKKYGLEKGEYDFILQQQNGACAICGTGDPGKRKTFAVDHDHKTGVVRGLLCFSCNVGLGHFKDDTKALSNAIHYLGGENE